MRPLTVLLLCACGPTDGPTFQPDEGTLWRHLQALQDVADTHGGHRALGSAGFDGSVDHVATSLAAMGLTPRIEPVVVLDWRSEFLEIEAEGRRLGPTEAVAMQWSVGGRIEGTAVPVDLLVPASPDPDTTSSGCQASDFDGFAAGTIALVQRGGCSFADKARHAEAARATAVLIFNEGQPGRTGLFEGSLDRYDVPDIPVIALTYEVGVALAGVPGVRITVDTTLRATETANVVADLEGDDPQRVTVGAHLDSVPVGPGINDNASGVALVLALAEALVSRPTPRRGVRFAFWGAEEVGLVGSLDHVRRLGDGDARDVLAYLNFDMVASPNGARLVYDGDGSSFGVGFGIPELAGSAAVEAAFHGHFEDRGRTTRPTPYDGRSDYLGFALAGIPSGGLFSGAESLKPESWVAAQGGEPERPFDGCYHEGCDDLDNTDVSLALELTDAALEVVGTLIAPPATAPELLGEATRRGGAIPTWSSGGCGHHVAR